MRRPCISFGVRIQVIASESVRTTKWDYWSYGLSERMAQVTAKYSCSVAEYWQNSLENTFDNYHTVAHSLDFLHPTADAERSLLRRNLPKSQPSFVARAWVAPIWVALKVALSVLQMSRPGLLHQVGSL